MIFMATYNIIIPLRMENDIWSFINPFSYEIWICTLISIPIFIFAMGIADYIANNKSVNWDISVGFVLRNVLSETMGNLPNKRPYQKILVFVWVWSCFVLVMSFSGSLTAMITRPKLDMKFTKLEHFLNQDEMSLVTEGGSALNEYMNSLGDDSITKKILLKTERLTSWDDWPSNCFTSSTQYTKRHASICDDLSILTLLSWDFEEAGKCNWYTMNAKIMGTGPLAMAFQVS